MNSLFSSFDALCAEVLGQMVKSSFPAHQLKSTAAVPSSNTVNTAKQEGPSSNTVNTAKQEGNMESSPEASPEARVKKQSRRTPPRFAVELDGLNCFETLVSR